jgi:hypothetical protein
VNRDEAAGRGKGKAGGRRQGGQRPGRIAPIGDRPGMTPGQEHQQRQRQERQDKSGEQIVGQKAQLDDMLPWRQQQALLGVIHRVERHRVAI